MNTIDIDYFINTLITDELANDIEKAGISFDLVADIIEDFNMMREGILLTAELPDKAFGKLCLTTCVCVDANGRKFNLKPQQHKQLTGDYTIYLSNGDNRIEMLNGVRKWYCVKDEGKVFPKAYLEFMRLIYTNEYFELIGVILDIHDTYIKAYNKATADLAA